MDERAMLPMPDSFHTVTRQLAAAHKHRDELLRLMTDFAAIDLRPIIIVNGELMPTRDFNIPDNLREMYREAAVEVARLEAALYDAYHRERAYRDGVIPSYS